MVELEKCNCENDIEAKTLEAFWIDILKPSLNIQIPNNFGKVNKDNCKNYSVKYRQLNRVKLLKSKKVWYDKNKIKIRQQQKAYYESHKELIAKQQKEYAERKKLEKQQQEEGK
jgi:hypothetical protein